MSIYEWKKRMTLRPLRLPLQLMMMCLVSLSVGKVCFADQLYGNDLHPNASYVHSMDLRDSSALELNSFEAWCQIWRFDLQMAKNHAYQAYRQGNFRQAKNSIAAGLQRVTQQTGYERNSLTYRVVQRGLEMARRIEAILGSSPGRERQVTLVLIGVADDAERTANSFDSTYFISTARNYYGDITVDDFFAVADEYVDQSIQNLFSFMNVFSYQSNLMSYPLEFSRLSSKAYLTGLSFHLDSISQDLNGGISYRYKNPCLSASLKSLSRFIRSQISTSYPSPIDMVNFVNEEVRNRLYDRPSCHRRVHRRY